MGVQTVDTQLFRVFIYLFANIGAYLPMNYVQISQHPGDHAGVYPIRQHAHLHRTPWSI